MFQSSRKTMKWSSLLKDIKEKVGLSSSPSPSSLSPAGAVVAAAAATAEADSASPGRNGFEVEAQPHTRDRHDLELDFKRYWEEFRSSSSEKEKETALNMAVDIFCRLVRQQMSVAQLVTTLVEAHIFSFVVGRAFVTDVEKLRIHSKSKSLHATQVMSFFSEATEDGLKPGSNLLFAVEVLVTWPIDKQPLLDSGILCCLIHILHALLNPDETKQFRPVVTLEVSTSHGKANDTDNIYMRQLEGKCIMSLDIGLLMAGAKERGELESRVTGLISEVKKAGDVILFIDEVHTLIGSGTVGRGNKGSGLDIANLLKPALGRCELQCIASTKVGRGGSAWRIHASM